MAKAKAKKNRPTDDVGKLSDALKVFSLHYGRDDTKLEKWQALCLDCGVERGSSIKKCKTALRSVAVNIWDLIKARKDDDLPAPRFRNKAELRVDLRNKSRRFPLSWTKGSDENKLLQALLVTVL